MWYQTPTDYIYHSESLYLAINQFSLSIHEPTEFNSYEPGVTSSANYDYYLQYFDSNTTTRRRLFSNTTIAIMSTSKPTVILNTKADWGPWLFVISTMAVGGEIWEFINPDLPEQPLEPTRPVAPLAREASISNSPNTTLATLTSDKQEVYKLLYNKYKESL